MELFPTSSRSTSGRRFSAGLLGKAQPTLRTHACLAGSPSTWPTHADPTSQAVSRAEVHVLIAYAAVMAWGGRGVDSRNYRVSLSAESLPYLTAILTKLRASSQNRQVDFAEMQLAAENIPGLGISFYTKLLFFFRDQADAYILDQFTAKSAKLLFDPCQIVLNSSGYPDADNTPLSYEWFCSAAESMGAGRTTLPIWTGEQVEQAMFDVRGGVWRKYLLSIFGRAGAKKIKKRKFLARGAAPTSGLVRSLPERVAIAHANAYLKGVEVPGANPQVQPPSRGKPVRLHCKRLDKLDYQYAFCHTRVHAEVFIPRQCVTRYDDLMVFLKVADHDFGDGIKGNGAKNGKTRSIKLTISSGLYSPETEWDEIADKAVAAMTALFGRVCEII